MNGAMCIIHTNAVNRLILGQITFFLAGDCMFKREVAVKFINCKLFDTDERRNVITSVIKFVQKSYPYN